MVATSVSEGAGNLCSPAGGSCTGITDDVNDLLYQVTVFRGKESFNDVDKAYWNLALGFNKAHFPAGETRSLRARATGDYSRRSGHDVVTRADPKSRPRDRHDHREQVSEPFVSNSPTKAPALSGARSVFARVIEPSMVPATKNDEAPATPAVNLEEPVPTPCGCAHIRPPSSAHE